MATFTIGFGENGECDVHVEEWQLRCEAYGVTEFMSYHPLSGRLCSKGMVELDKCRSLIEAIAYYVEYLIEKEDLSKMTLGEVISCLCISPASMSCRVSDGGRREEDGLQDCSFF